MARQAAVAHSRTKAAAGGRRPPRASPARGEPLPPQPPARPDTTLAGQIAERLARRIVLGELPPGARLRQDAVAAEFGASHVPVREAFRRLEARGLASSEPRRGVRVAALDPRAVREVTAMRAVLEPLALRHALDAMTPEDLAAAEAALAEGEASHDLAIWDAANRRFHLALVRPCALPRLLATLADLHSAASRSLIATWRERDWRGRSDGEHRELLALVRAGRGAAACALLARHVAEAGEALLRGR